MSVLAVWGRRFRGWSFATHVGVALALRLALLTWGEWQDRHWAFKFTDVDYRVYTDGARHVSLGQSPYLRHTYRYSPLLAWLMVPNILIHPAWGKGLLVVVDLAVGGLIRACVLRDEGGGGSPASAHWAGLLWLYNPFAWAIAARGSAEALVVLLILVMLYLFHRHMYLLSGLTLGLAIHLKLYPIIYSLMLYLSLSRRSGWLARLCLVNGEQFRFTLGTVGALIASTLWALSLYGSEYATEAWLYHLERKDIRHNFSPYFYLLYLTHDVDDAGLGWLTFLPQLVVCGATTWAWARRADLHFGLFALTAVFVAFNKVCTSQYFLWYLALLPLTAHRLPFSLAEWLGMGILWGAAQAAWLMAAYYLEFEGTDTFQVLWLEGLAFFCANVGLLSKLIRTYRSTSPAS
eukprot:snap_masked-scaffold1256_size52432-processed-gene-0.4 protein:Tk09002 transcript:snap_masked-scaffold1256_size52432-processed-gene-0.4-mRNA-1 annotation:"gpi mannosyltransferase 1"